MSEPTEFSCPTCGEVFDSPKGLGSHRKAHRRPYAPCPVCKKPLKDVEKHVRDVHKTEPVAPEVDLLQHEEVQKLRAENVQLREKVASQSRTAERKNARIRGLEKKAAKLPGLQATLKDLKSRVEDLTRERRHLGIHD